MYSLKVTSNGLTGIICCVGPAGGSTPLEKNVTEESLYQYHTLHFIIHLTDLLRTTLLKKNKDSKNVYIKIKKSYYSDLSILHT
jgi:hypothetical protein